MNSTPGRRRGVAAPVVLALCLPTIAPAQTGKAQSVTVVNPATSPVPVKAMGTVPVTGTVGISGPVPVTGTVAVSGPVSVTGTVGVSGSPSVNVANATAANPLSVRTLTREPIDLAGFGSPSGPAGTDDCVVELLDVPPGKRLVVEQVTGQAIVTKVPSFTFETVRLDNGASVHNEITGSMIPALYVLEPKLLAGSNWDIVLVSQQVRIYVQSGKRLRISWGPRNYAPKNCWTYVSGHLEPAELAPLP